ncbi:hypothetical protein K525DRAFT_257163, partial [Schizophyllum commune Loenen D]
MAAQVTYNPIVQESVNVVQTLGMQIMVNLFLEGVQMALGFAAISALAHAGGKKIALYFAVILVMLALFVNTVMNLLFNVMQIPGVLAANYPDPQGLADRLTRMKIAADVLRKVLFVSDIIVIWRAWIMYSKSYMVKTLLVLCALCGLGGLLVHSVYYDDPTHDYPEAMSLLLPVCTLAMNGIAILLVSWRLWTYRRDI